MNKKPEPQTKPEKTNKDKNFARLIMKEAIVLIEDIYVDCKMHEAEGTYKVRQSTYDY